jgi:enoyl-CoA hydratase/carnithine racemase
MNEAYLAGMEEVLDGLAAAKADLRGVIVTSAKKTFFAGGDLETLIRYGPDDAAAVFDTSPDQGAAAAAGDPRPAGRGRGDRHRARRGPGDRPGLPSPHRPRRAGRGLRAA